MRRYAEQIYDQITRPCRSQTSSNTQSFVSNCRFWSVKTDTKHERAEFWLTIFVSGKLRNTLLL